MAAARTVVAMLRAAPWLALAGAALLYLRLNDGAWVVTPDSATYMEGARALAAHQGFVDASGTAISIVPPGTSAVYSLAAMIPSAHYRYFNLTTKILVIAFLALAGLVIRRSTNAPVAAAAILFLALSNTLLLESTRILSDIPFSAAFMLTVWLFPADRLDDLPPKAALALGGLVASCYVLRTAGLFVFVACAAYVAVGVRRGRARTLAIVGVVFFAAAIILWLRSRHATGEYSYTQVVLMRQQWVADSGVAGLQDWYARVVGNVGGLVRATYEIFANQQSLRVYGAAVGILLIVGALAGVGRRQSRLHLLLIACYVPLLLATLVDRRYLLPIAPLLVILVCDGARWITDRLGQSAARRVVGVVLVLVLVVSPYWLDGLSYARRLRARMDAAGGAPIVYRDHEEFVRLVDRYDRTLSPQDVVGTMHADVLRYFLNSAARAWSLPIRVNVDDTYRAIMNAGTTYLFCDKSVALIWTHVEPAIRSHPASFELLDETPAAAIYRVVR